MKGMPPDPSVVEKLTGLVCHRHRGFPMSSLDTIGSLGGLAGHLVDVRHLRDGSRYLLDPEHGLGWRGCRSPLLLEDLVQVVLISEEQGKGDDEENDDEGNSGQKHGE
jgi:hypothetical protein